MSTQTWASGSCPGLQQRPIIPLRDFTVKYGFEGFQLLHHCLITEPFISFWTNANIIHNGWNNTRTTKTVRQLMHVIVVLN